MADIELHQTREMYAEKMKEFDTRWRTLEAGQMEVKQNLIKFNNFVREKQGKVESGGERVRSERELQTKRDTELEQLKQEVETLQKARVMMEKTVKQRQLFSDYLGRVVDLEPESFPDIRSLMKRCQALVGTR